jgi:hypothetical protein
MLSRMRITDKAVDEFIEIYREEFGEEISRSEASEIAFQLVNLYETLAMRLEHEKSMPSDPQRQPIGFRA